MVRKMLIGHIHNTQSLQNLQIKVTCVLGKSVARIEVQFCGLGCIICSANRMSGRWESWGLINGYPFNGVARHVKRTCKPMMLTGAPSAVPVHPVIIGRSVLSLLRFERMAKWIVVISSMLSILVSSVTSWSCLCRFAGEAKPICWILLRVFSSS